MKKNKPNIYFSLIFIFLLSGCGTAATPTPFRPPTSAISIPTTTPIPFTPEAFNTAENIPSADATTSLPVDFPTAITTACTDHLKFIDDITYKDNESVAPGQAIEKRWLVQNDGSCDWNSAYRLRFVGGFEMSAKTEQALFPARANAQVVIVVYFTAPFEAGVYRSDWQAFNADGVQFMDPLYIQIIVQVP